MAKLARTTVEAKTQYKVKYEYRTTLFGIIGWWVEISATSIKNIIKIHATQMPKEVILIVDNKVYKFDVKNHDKH